MLGPDLLLAPALEPEATARDVRLPAGVWHDFWTGRAYAGGGVNRVPTEPGRVPLLVRGGALLPLGPTHAFIADGHVFDALELHAYPPYPARFTLYEDDGLTRAYQRGEFARTTFSVSEANDELVIEVQPEPGPWRPPFARRAITVVLHGVGGSIAATSTEPVTVGYDAATDCARLSFELAPGAAGLARVRVARA
jgi:alpha-glucosidase